MADLDALRKACNSVKKRAGDEVHILFKRSNPEDILWYYMWVCEDNSVGTFCTEVRGQERLNICAQNMGFFPARLNSTIRTEGRVTFSGSTEDERQKEISCVVSPGRMGVTGIAHHQKTLEVQKGEACTATLQATFAAAVTFPESTKEYRTDGYLTVAVPEKP